MSVQWNQDRWRQEEIPGSPLDTETSDGGQIVSSINALVYQVKRLADAFDSYLDRGQ